MQWISGARFRMGSDDHYPEEAPARDVQVDSFWIDLAPVTNRDFSNFVTATGHVTQAEEAPDPADYPGAMPELLKPSSLVFIPPSGPAHGIYDWWRFIPGADWRHPYGPSSSIVGLDDHPVVHVAWRDVEAYCDWAGKALPTEAEWELAARGGLPNAEFAWGDELHPGGRYMANTWHGRFPFHNDASDGYERTSPVGAFPPNKFGLYDMIGNVWEWTSDWYSEPKRRSGPRKSCCAPKNPRGGAEQESVDPQQPGIRIPRKVLKGGSHLCAPSYCRRYRPAARHAHPVDTSTSHIGFRCVVRTGGPD